MAKITIAELDIDVQALIANTSQVKKSLDDLKKNQIELQKAGETNSKQFIENASNIKLLSSEYNAGVKAISENTKAVEEQANRTQLLNMALNQEVTSINDAREQNKILTKLRNEAITTTGEQSDEVKALNKKLDENNDFIKTNADAYLRLKLNIGNYSESVKEALQNINPLNGGLTGFVQRSQQAGGAGNLLKESLGGAITGMWGMIKASLAFIATPVGAVVAVLAGAVLILYNTFSKLDPVLDKIEQGFAGITAIIDTGRQAVLAFVTGAKSFVDAFGNIGNSMAEAGKEAMKLKEQQQDLKDAMSSQEVTNAKASALYDELILKSKNRTLTEKERVAFIKQAQAVEEANFKQRSALAEKDLKQAIESAKIKGDLSNKELQNLQKNTVAYANYLLNAGRISQEEFDAIKKAELGKVAIRAESTKRLEKAQNTVDKLNDDAKAKAEKAQQDEETRRQKAQANAEKATQKAIERSKQELDIFIAQQGVRAKTLEESLKTEEVIRDKKLAVNKDEYQKKLITSTQFELKNIEIKNEFLKKQMDIAVTSADMELQIYLENNKTRLESGKFLNDALYQEELKRLNAVSEAEATAQTEKLVAGAITAEQYNLAIQAIDSKYATDKKALDDKKTEDDKAKKAIDLENKLASDTANHDYDLAFQTQALEEKRLVEIANAEKTGADTKLINDKYAKQKMEVESIVANNKLQLASQTFGNLATILGKESSAGKAMAVAQTTIDTYQSATSAYKAMAGIPVVGPVLGAVAAGAAVVSGLANVKKILSTDNAPKFESGGIQEIGGRRHSAGGTKFWGEDGTVFEAEAGEGIGVLNRGAFASFMDFNNRFGSGGASTPTFMAGGGIITQGVSSGNNSSSETISAMAEMIKRMPAPIVTVEDINAKTDEVATVVSGANF